MKRGDWDQEHNIIFFHPYCQFCQINLYNEEKLVQHIQKEHIQCHLCDETRKYFYFKDYKSLEIHFNISHYLCQNENCREKAFQVFSSAAELEAHTIKVHSDGQNQSKNSKLINPTLLHKITGFDYGQSERLHKRDIKTQVKDREGVDFESQFLSQIKIKTKLQLQQSNANEVLDLRKYFPSNKELLEFDVNQIYNEMMGISTTDYDDYYDDSHGKRKNKKKGDARNKKNAQQSNVIGPLYFEDCNMASYLNIDMDSKTLYDRFRELIPEKDYHTIRGAIEDYYKGRCDHKFLFSKFLEIFGDRALFKIFPFYLATIQKEDTAKYLDSFFYSKMLELPKRSSSFISSCKTYGELFQKMYSIIEKEIVARIENGKFDISKKNIVMDPARIFQMMQIIRRVENIGMANFKFTTNFGILVETKDKLTSGLTEPVGTLEKLVAGISDFEIIILLKYLELVLDKVEGKNINLEVKDISMILVDNLLTKKPQLQDKFKAALGENWKKEVKEDKTVFTDDGQVRKIRTKHAGPHHHIQNEAEHYSPSKYEETKQFDIKNAYEFPDLKKSATDSSNQTTGSTVSEKMGITSYEIKKPAAKKKPMDVSGWANKNVNPFLAPEFKAKEGASKLEEEFPTLSMSGPSDKKGDGAEFWKHVDKKKESKTQPNKKEEEYYEEEYKDDDYWESEELPPKGSNTGGMKIAGVQKTKKGKQKIFLAGGFK